MRLTIRSDIEAASISLALPRLTLLDARARLVRLHRAGELVARKRDVIDAEAHMLCGTHSSDAHKRHFGAPSVRHWALVAQFSDPWKSLTDLRSLLDSTHISGLIGQTPSLVESTLDADATLVPIPLNSSQDSHNRQAAGTAADDRPMKPVPAGSTSTTTHPRSGLAQQSLTNLLPVNPNETQAGVVFVTQRTPALAALQLLAGPAQFTAVTDDSTGALVGQWTWSVVRDPDTLVRILVDPGVVVGQLVPEPDMLVSPATKV
ncbi:hypothetical protein BCR44DRAFT_1515456 [Catenaria anguillulae PL171]|uniref:Uncharacterized protein n=1 Tax=Catenaria anguillulae PL171 TaxID=765915 RepID=A0A1Y2HD97_9FUNG|nr:hypothetical protein BCR44DRAFT_1515456 [Catenaria anguillulae PL171]